RRAKTRVPVGGRRSFPVNPNVPADPGKLNSNRIYAVHSCAMRRLERDFRRCLKRKNLRTGVGGAIVDPRLSARIEFYRLNKRVLRWGRGGRASHRILKGSG